jgi:mannose-1-phosphate guanylyltransferase/mannose-1-phosphate guanylyltransferase/mannose-6-phosphate isomerase
MSVSIVPAILSGGSGSRLWPLSRAARPKQFLPLQAGGSLLQAALERAAPGADIAFSRPVLICNQDHSDLVDAELKAAGMTAELVLFEPEGRNTGAAAAAVALAVERRLGPDALVLLAPADHSVTDVAAFRAAVAAGAELAMAGRVVTLGIDPDGPKTDYGYIQRGASLGPGFEIEAFKEKPDADTAAAWLAEGGWYWNAGVFLFRAGDLIAAMTRLCPDIIEPVRESLAAGTEADGRFALEAASFGRATSAPIDIAVMEKLGAAAVVPVSCGWDDLGSYEALWRAGANGPDAIVTGGDGEVVTEAGRRLFIRAEGVTVAAAGLENFVVIATGNTVLIAPLGDPAAIRTLRERLREAGREDLL